MLFETSCLLAEVVFLCKFFKLEIQVRHLHSPPAIPHKFENMNIIHLNSSEMGRRKHWKLTGEHFDYKNF